MHESSQGLILTQAFDWFELGQTATVCTSVTGRVNDCGATTAEHTAAQLWILARGLL